MCSRGLYPGRMVGLFGLFENLGESVCGADQQLPPGGSGAGLSWSDAADLAGEGEQGEGHDEAGEEWGQHEAVAQLDGEAVAALPAGLPDEAPGNRCPPAEAAEG